MKSCAILLLLIRGIAAAAEEPRDFAYGIAIHADSADALHEIEIPAAVYRGVTRSDLGDLRVFNGQGEVVPHALRPRVASTAERGDSVRLPVFPLYGETTNTIEDLNLRVEKRADGTVIRIQSQKKGAERKDRLRGYLIDASTLKSSIHALQFDWQAGSASFVGKIRVDGSDDLTRWTNLADNAALARLIFDGHRVERDRVELRAAKLKYLRLSWPENQAALDRLVVRAEPAAKRVATPRNWQKISGSSVAGTTGEYGYDLGGFFPVDRLRVELPQVNSLAQLEIHWRAKPDEPWRLARSVVAYRLRDRDAEVTSPEILVPVNSARYWLVRVDQKGGGIGGGVPGLQVGWATQKLVFAARGAGPYQLAYGASRVAPAAFAIESLIPGYNTDAEFKVKHAPLGEPTTLAGTARLRAPVDYKKIALWSTLIVGVALLGWMAFRLSRQITKAPPVSQKTDDKA
jgi:hypothetical protein